MKRYINMVLFASIIIVAAIVACNKKLNVTDQNDPTVQSYFKVASELQDGVNGIYSSMRGGNLVGREWFFTHDMRGSETNSGGAQLEQARADLLKQPSPSPSNAVMTSVWSGVYQMINRANQVISSAATVTDNPASRDVSVGEAKFLRAWAYFELVSMWGPVPLYLQPVVTATGYKGQSPAADVYTAIIADLTDAATKLPATAANGHATSGAANTLLGRVQMQNGNYAAAKAALLLVTGSGKYKLVDNFLDNFDGDVADAKGTFATGHEYNAESIFEVSFVDKGDDNFNWGYTGEGPTADMSIMRSQEYGVVWGNVVPSDAILNEFEAGDPRYKFTFYEPGDSIVRHGDLSISPPDKPTVLTPLGMNVAPSNHNGLVEKRVYRKGSVLDWTDDGFHPDGVNMRIMRYADVLLMLAECEAEVGTPAAAAGYINQVRDRASVMMPHVAPATKIDALAAVMHERAVELAGEEVNNIDMLRWRAKGYYSSVRADPKPGQVALFPIPAQEASANPLIK